MAVDKIYVDVEFIGIHATGWFVTGTVAADGVIATPFS